MVSCGWRRVSTWEMNGIRAYGLLNYLVYRFVKSLEIAYKYANHTLLKLLTKDQQLHARLR